MKKITNFMRNIRTSFIAWLLVDYLKMDFFIDGDSKKCRIFIGLKHGDGLQKWYPVNITANEIHDRIYLSRKK